MTLRTRRPEKRRRARGRARSAPPTGRRAWSTARRSLWQAIQTAGMAHVTVCLSLTVWSLLPMLIGWQASVVISGSMTPAVRPGDVVVFDHPPFSSLGPGQVILIDDPGRPGALLTHRVALRREDGTIVTKGDANSDADVFPVDSRHVRGRARLVVPYVGRIGLWGTPYRQQAALWTAITALACATVAVSGPVARRRAAWAHQPTRRGHEHRGRGRDARRRRASRPSAPRGTAATRPGRRSVEAIRFRCCPGAARRATSLRSLAVLPMRLNVTRNGIARGGQ